MYHRGRKVYPGRYEYRGYYVTHTKIYGWTVCEGLSLSANYLARGLNTKKAAFAFIDNLFKGKGGDHVEPA